QAAPAARRDRPGRGGRRPAGVRARGQAVRPRQRAHRQGHRRHRHRPLHPDPAGGLTRAFGLASGLSRFRNGPMPRPAPLLTSLFATLALAACQPEGSAPADAGATAPSTSIVDEAHDFQDAIAPEDLARHVQVLASDEFEGRAPGTVGEDKTVEYIKAQFERLGLQPGNNGDWFQTVPMVETTADESTVLHLTVNGEPQDLAFGDDMVIGTRTGQQEVEVEDSPVVFVGYGVDAPEQDWNDYAGIDVKGKTVVMLVNDPGFHANDDALFEGKRMTYYGRWTYKFEEAARKGA